MTISPPPLRQPGDPIPPMPEPRYPWRVGVTMAALVVLILGVLWLAFQVFKGPPTADEYPSPATATAVRRAFDATVSAADTAQPRATRPPTRPPTPQPTVAPIRAPVGLSASTPQPATNTSGAAVGSTPTLAAAPTSLPAQNSLSDGQSAQAGPGATLTGVSTAVAAPTPEPTVAPELVSDVSAAYVHYWQVVADTALSLDPAPLEQVAAGSQLTSLQQSIEADKASNRATKMDIQHNFVVISADNSRAEVADRLRYGSITVDASTHEPLPDQLQATSSEEAPETDAILDLQRTNGVWKVIEASRAVAEGRVP